MLEHLLRGRQLAGTSTQGPAVGRSVHNQRIGGTYSHSAPSYSSTVYLATWKIVGATMKLIYSVSITILFPA